MGDLAASTTGLLGALAGAPGELVRLLITAAGVTGGYIQDRFEGPARLPDPAPQRRGIIGRVARPMQYPDRAGFAAYVPAGLAFIGSGLVQNLTYQNTVSVAGQALNVAGVSDIIGGASLLAGYSAVILLEDPRSGAVMTRFDGASVELAPGEEGFLLRETGEPVGVKPGQVLELCVGETDSDPRSLGLPEYCAMPVAMRPPLRELRVREGVTLDRLARWTRTLGGWEPGRFQLFTLGATAGTYFNWGALADRATRADWHKVGSGLSTGDVTNPNFWQALLEGGSVAAQGVVTAAFTAAYVSFAVARAEQQPPVDRKGRDPAAPQAVESNPGTRPRPGG